MENTLENKMRFVAQYYGQKVALIPDYDEGLDLIMAVVSRVQEIKCLKLTSLSDITDEDAIEVAKLFFNKGKRDITISLTNTCNKSFGFSFWVNHETEYQLHYDFSLICLSTKDPFSRYTEKAIQESVDFLRRGGYALSFNSLSVEQQIEYGWIKLKPIS